jgi:hypothetical protein
LSWRKRSSAGTRDPGTYIRRGLFRDDALVRGHDCSVETGLSVVTSYGAGAAVNLAAGLLPAPVRGGALGPRAAAVAASICALAIPFFLDAPPVFRAIQAGVLAVLSCRVVEIARAPWCYGRLERVARMLLVHETRLMKPARPSLPLGALAAGVIFLGVGMVVFGTSARLAPPTPPYGIAGWPRWLAAGVGCYLLIEGVARILVAAARPFGWEHEAVQRAPVLSRTLAEFWGVRWNRVVGRVLRRNFYQPLARRGAPVLGVLLAFAMSAVLHFYLVLPAAGLVPAIWMGTFFLVHGILCLLEVRLSVRRWPPIAGRAFVVAAFVATIPLFAEPLLRCFLL